MRKLFLVFLILFAGGLLFTQTALLSRQSRETFETQTNVYFSPEGNARKAIIAEMNQAKKTINIAMYFFSDHTLANALARAKERGVQINIVMDRENSAEKNSKRIFFQQKELAARYYAPEVKGKKGKPGKMHHKFATIDGQVVITGSFNWTYSAEKYNNEDLLIIHSPKLARAYLNRWQTLWSRGITHQELLELEK